MASALPNMKWGSPKLICLVTCIYGFATLHAALGDGAYFGDLATEKPFSQLAIAWVSDVHLQPHSSMVAQEGKALTQTPGAPGRKCLEMETCPALGVAGSGSSPRLFGETLDFLGGLVAQSHAAATAGHPTASSTASSAAEAAFLQYPLPPITTILLTVDYAHSRKNHAPNFL